MVFVAVCMITWLFVNSSASFIVFLFGAVLALSSSKFFSTVLSSSFLIVKLANFSIILSVSFCWLRFLLASVFPSLSLFYFLSWFTFVPRFSTLSHGPRSFDLLTPSSALSAAFAQLLSLCPINLQ
ncbi:uncharacterized protein DS421_5g149790 [Arachis hypogaea]|nr:uncharacterized protein DS421_5g149790 [Arachis hypogaea]